MKQNPYKNLTEQVSVPAGLNERVLRAAHQAAPTHGGRRVAAKAARRPLLPRVLCAACALALVLTGLYLRPAPAAPSVPGADIPVQGIASGYTFGIAAYAAETEKTTPMAAGKLAIGTGNGVSSPEIGYYTGCLFRITGDNIQTVSASIDRGGFYRQITRRDLTPEQINEIQQAQERGELPPTSVMRNSNDVWFFDELTALGNSFTEGFDSAASYGFWVPPAELPEYKGEDLREEAHQSIDTFDGAVLTLTVTFTDGSTQTQTLTLRTDRLKVVYEENGTQTVLPEVVGPEEPYLYGVYAESDGAETASATAARFYVVPYSSNQTVLSQAQRGDIQFSFGSWGSGDGQRSYLMQLFQVKGEGIQTVSATIDRGSFWRSYLYVSDTKDPTVDFQKLGKELCGDEPIGVLMHGGGIHDKYYHHLQWPLESGFWDDYRSDITYGLSIPVEAEGEPLMPLGNKLQSFDGAALSITVTFTDGTTETQHFTLRFGHYEVEFDENTGCYNAIRPYEKDVTAEDATVYSLLAAERQD